MFPSLEPSQLTFAGTCERCSVTLRLPTKVSVVV